MWRLGKWLAVAVLVALMGFVVFAKVRAVLRYRQAARLLSLAKQAKVGADGSALVAEFVRMGARKNEGCYDVGGVYGFWTVVEQVINPRFDDAGAHTRMLRLAADLGIRLSWVHSELCVDPATQRIASIGYMMTYCLRDGSWRAASFYIQQRRAHAPYQEVRAGYEASPVNMTTLGGGVGIKTKLTSQAAPTDLERGTNINLACLTSSEDCHLCRVMPDAWKDGPFTAEWESNHELTPSEINQAKRHCEGLGPHPDENYRR